MSEVTKMTAMLIIILIAVVRWSASHVVYPKELPRVRLEEWRPVRDDPFGRHTMRYPIFHKGHYGLTPPKKIPMRQVGEHSEKVEVFSPAPPSILGSFSVFGHATVNAREHASHMAKKPQRSPQEDSRPAYSSYPVRHALLPDHQKTLPQRFQTFDEQNFFFEASLRPPPRGVNHPHSASLSPNSYYFEPPQPFQAPSPDVINSFLKPRKPVLKGHGPYRNGGPGVFHDRFKPSTQSPNLGFFDQVSQTDLPKPVGNRGTHGYYDRDPFSPATRRPETIETITGERAPGKDVFQRLSHLGRPFQNSPPFSPSPIPQGEEDLYRPFVTTFSPTSLGNNVKFSPIGRPFQVPVYDGLPTVVSSVKPEFFVTQRPYTQDVFTGTTIDLPTGQGEETEKPAKETYTEGSFAPVSRPRPYSKPQAPSYDSPHHRRPQVQITSYQGFNEDAPPPFLPTPSTDTETYLNKPASEEGSTPNPVNYNDVSKKRKNQASQSFRDSPKPTEYFSDYISTTEEPEITTRYRHPTSKPRRRPGRPISTTHKPTEEPTISDSNIKNHRLPEEETVSSTTEYTKHHRRRKPHYPPYRGGGYGSKNRHSDVPKYRTTTTTTTTPEPEIFPVTQFSNEFTVTEGEDSGTTLTPTDVQIEEFDSGNTHYAEKIPFNEVHTHENDRYNNYYEEVPTTLQAITTTTATTQATTTTPAPTTQPSTSSTSVSTRFKTKYNNNRPRFSVKDYRERLNRATSTTHSPEPEEPETVKSTTEINKYSIRNRGYSQYKPNGENNNTADARRKYKPRIGPSRYKTSTTSSPTDTTTTERTNTFRPSTNRYKPGTGKYYSRYRTSTAQPKESEEGGASTTTRAPARPKGVFSAKRRPFPLKPKADRNKDTSNDTESHRISYQGETVKTVENEVLPATTVISKKMDDSATTTVTSAESLDGVISDPTGAEAMRVADLTSSSSNEFESSGFLKGVSPSSRRTIPKITIATDDPILPLEAFFQTQNNKDK